MKKYMLALVATILMSSCAQHINVKDRYVLHNQYMKYVSLLNNHDYSPAIGMLSQRNVEDLVSNSNKELFSKHFPVLSAINQVLAAEQGNFEKLNNNEGCLTVFGVDPSNEPTSINIEYLNEGGVWKLDYAQVIYHGSISELPHMAVCPSRM
jgi:hypothetical protein